jgi:hypothetical protein
MNIASNQLCTLAGYLDICCRVCSITTNADAFGSTWVFVETPTGVVHVPASFVTSTRTPIDGKGSILPRHTSHTIYVEDHE